MMLLCSINGVYIEGRAGQEVLENAGLTHAFQGMKRCPPTRTAPHPFGPRAGTLPSWRGCAGSNMGKHQMANFIAILFQVRLPSGL